MVSSHHKNFFIAFNTLVTLIVIILIVRGPISEEPAQETKAIAPSEVQVAVTPPLQEIEQVINVIQEELKKQELFEYVQVTDSCASHFQGTCVNVRTAPSDTAPVAYKLRNGIVLKVSGKVTADGRDWYKVFFDEWLRYPKRVSPNLYIAADYVVPFLDEGNKESHSGASSTKYILIDRSSQTLYAYEGKELFMKQKVSTGLELTPTPRGTFTIYRKTPSRYMQGPIPGISTHYYDLPGVPWNLYFSKEGAVIHGAYWHDSFGKQWSNGCVNVPVESAEKLYKWAEVGTQVIVRD